MGAGLCSARHPGFAGLAASGIGAVSGRCDRVISWRSRPPARARRRLPCASPESCWPTASSTGSPSSCRPNTSRSSGRWRPRGVGIALDPKFSNSSAQTSSEYHGVVVTYAQVASHPARHRVRTENRRTLVVFDEIHHGGDAKSWGEAIREAFGDATRRLALTGTPFRSDDSPIPFVTYEPDGDGPAALAGRPHLRLRRGAGRRRGPAGGVPGLLRRGALARQRGRGTRRPARRAAERRADRPGLAHRARTRPASGCPRCSRPPTPGCSQQRQAACPTPAAWSSPPTRPPPAPTPTLLTKITGEAPTVVLSDDPGSSDRIAEFSAGTSRWLVAVRMVSEGVDVPRLAVGVYATSASTPLFFAQAIGRFVRSRRPGETASIFLPSVPNLLLLASEMEAQRNHVLGKPHRESTGRRGATSNEQQKSEPSELDNGFESLGADAELDQVIFDGSSFGTATPAGSEEEADYLGIPGLLDAGADARPVAAQAGRATRRSAQHPARCPGRRNTGSCANFAANSMRWCRSPITAPASRTGGSTTSCAGSAAARRSRRRRRTSSSLASKRCAVCNCGSMTYLA